jgi:hypothetical protein
LYILSVLPLENSIFVPSQDNPVHPVLPVTKESVIVGENPSCLYTLLFDRVIKLVPSEAIPTGSVPEGLEILSSIELENPLCL